MRRLKYAMTGLVVTMMMLNAVGVLAADKGDFLTTPTKNNGQKWRIGFYQGGDYTDYPKVLGVTIEALIKMQWFEPAEIPNFAGKPSREMWEWLGANLTSSYIEFVDDAFYSSDWNEDLRQKVPAELMARMQERQDLDMLIAMGTWAGQDLANDRHSTPTIVMSTTDPLGAGIIKSIEDSGHDHVHARIDPTRQERQAWIFHDIIGFQRMGIYYTDTSDGRSYAAIDKIERVAADKGFELVRCFTKDASVGEAEAVESVNACMEELSQSSDAIFVAIHPAIKVKHVPTIVEIANSAFVPTFSQYGSEEVKMGILMSISQAGFKYLGQFEAETIAKVLNGAKPRDIGQIFEDPPKIAINLKTAEMIGYDPPVDVLGVADEIYQEITQPE